MRWSWASPAPARESPEAYQATLQGHDVRHLEADTEFARYALTTTTEHISLLKEWVEPNLSVLDDLFLARRIGEHAAEVLQTPPPSLTSSCTDA